MKVRAGDTFGRLTAVRDVGRSNDGHRVWLCKCQCGAECTRQSNNLQAKALVSCGCAQRDLRVKHGGKGTSAYDAWAGAIGRCGNAASKDFHKYGGRGITVCDRWRHSFENFIADMGEKPSGTSLDRIDNNGNYEPGNCRWATATEQVRNRRNSAHVEWGGRSLPLAEVAALIGITYGAAFMRLKRGTLNEHLV